MNFTSKSKTKYFWTGQDFCLMMALSVALLLPFGKVGLAAKTESLQHFKMLSTVEYTGKGQFRNQVETLFTVRRQPLDGDKVRYFISTDDFDLVGGNINSGQQSPSFAGNLPKLHQNTGGSDIEQALGRLVKNTEQNSREPSRESSRESSRELSSELSFVVDTKTKHLSEVSKELELFEKVNNECVEFLRKVTKENIGKTWKQPFYLWLSLDSSLPSKLDFTLTAIPVKTKVLGEMIAVRALSEPFVVEAAKKGGGTGPVKSRIGAVYLFDPEIEDIYLSISAFEATTNINGFKEKLRHEVATYMSDAAGASVDLSGLGKKFEKLVRKLRLTKKSFKVAKESLLPQWARSECLNASQVASMCAAMACEGASNPVVTVCIPVARTVAMQSLGTLTPIGGLAVAGLGTVTGSLGAGVPAVGALNIAAGPAFLGVGLGTAGAIAGGTVGTVAIAGGGGGGGGAGGAGTVTPASP